MTFQLTAGKLLVNTNLKGDGPLTPILTGGLNGTKVVSIRIKPIDYYGTQIVRLFISTGGKPVLFKEAKINTFENGPNNTYPDILIEFDEASKLTLPYDSVLYGCVSNGENTNYIGHGVNL